MSKAIDDRLEAIVNRQEEINLYVLNLIAERVKETKEIIPSDVYKIERLIKSGNDVRKINKLIAKIAGISVKEIEKLIYEVAKESYADTLPFYEYRKMKFIPFYKNKELQRVCQSIAKQTVDSYLNIAKAQAFMLRDEVTKKLIPTTIANAYQKTLDKAIQALQQGTLSYDKAMKSTLKELVDSGLKTVTYHPESGRVYSQRLDTAVRRNLLDGVRAINQGVQDITGQQFGADGVEITVHSNPAPDHCNCQGHQFTNEEFEKMQNEMSFVDVQGRQYKSFQRAIGTLNCRHFTYSIIVGVTNPNYSDEQLKEILSKNEKGVTISIKGKSTHLTMYECTQKQRDYELKIRQLRERLQVAEKAQNSELISETKAKLSDNLKEYQMFSVKCGLKSRLNKTLLII